MKKIVVFGATGKVGAYLTLYLKECGYEVVAAGKRADDRHFFEDHGIPYRSVDILRPESLAVLPEKGVYGVIHLAAVLPATMPGYHPRVYVESNITGTLNVLDYAVSAGAERFVYPRTVADVYHLYGSLKPIDPDAPSRFPLNTDHSVYTITKNAAVDLVRHYAARYGFRCYILRFPNIFCYHPNPTYYKDGRKRWQGLRLLIEQAKAGEDIELWGNPDCARDFFYVKDCVRLIERTLSSDGGSGVYNVGTGKAVTRMEQIQGIIRVFSPKDRPSRIVIDRSRPDSPFFLLDIRKTVEELGYTPKYDYISALEDLKREMELNRFEPLWGTEADYTEPYAAGGRTAGGEGADAKPIDHERESI